MGSGASQPTAFASEKYRPSWELAQEHLTREELEEINALGLAIAAELEQGRRLAAAYLYDPAHWHEDSSGAVGQCASLHDDEPPGATAARAPTLEHLRRLQEAEVASLIGIVDKLTELAAELVPGTPAELQAHGDRDATQEVEPCFADKTFADDVKVAEMSEDVREIMAKAAEMIAIDDMYNAVLPDEAYARDFRDGSDQVDEIWLGIKSPFGSWDQDGCVTHLTFLFAKHLVVSAAFHEEMEELLGPFGDVSAPNGPLQHAKMKSSSRVRVKTNSNGDYGMDAMEAENRAYSEPNTKFVRDILRVSLLVRSHDDLVEAHARLVARYEPVATKDRRAEKPRDVLQSVWFEGDCGAVKVRVIVEVQFHFASVIAAKKFSHAAYNISRVPLDDFNGIHNAIYEFGFIELEKYSSVEDGLERGIKHLIHV